MLTLVFLKTNVNEAMLTSIFLKIDVVFLIKLKNWKALSHLALSLSQTLPHKPYLALRPSSSPSSLPLPLTPKVESRKATVRPWSRSSHVCCDAHRRVLVSFLVFLEWSSLLSLSLSLSLNDLCCIPCHYHYLWTTFVAFLAAIPLAGKLSLLVFLLVITR